MSFQSENDLSLFQKGFLACAFKNISASIGTLRDKEKFLLSYTPTLVDERGSIFHQGDSFLPSFLSKNFSKIFDQAGCFKNPEIGAKLNEFASFVLQNEKKLGFDPKKSHFSLTSIQEQIGTSHFDRWHNNLNFHRDEISNPKARIYFVSDDVSPTLIKNNEGHILTCLPYTVYCISGHTLHSRGPIIGSGKDIADEQRNFARLIVS